MGATNGDGAESAAERKPTERVVLRRVLALEVPADASTEQVEAARKALQGKSRAKVDAPREAWTEVARNVAATKVAAIETYAGKPGTPDAKIGTFRAPTITAWKDARVYEAPPLPLVEVSTVD